MRHLLPLALLAVCATAYAQEVPADENFSPVRDAHIVTVSEVNGEYVFEIEGQPRDLSAALEPGGTLVVRTVLDVNILVVAEDGTTSVRSSHDTDEVAGFVPVIVGPNARMLSRDYRSEVSLTTLRVLPEVHRGSRASVAVSLLVCVGGDSGTGSCSDWRAAAPRRPTATGGLSSGFFIDVLGAPMVYSGGAGTPPDPPVTPVRD